MSVPSLIIVAALSTQPLSASDAKPTSQEPLQAAESDTIDEIEVIGKPLPISLKTLPTVDLNLDFDRTGRLDILLARVPGAGLFRRADSFSAHPTTQGLALRGVGANAAGRALVTLDGVPLNDPFGGWIYWSAIDPFSLDSVRLVQSGGVGAYGAQALAGSLALESRRPNEDGVRLQARFGSLDASLLSASVDKVLDRGFVSVSASFQENDGFFIREAENRGPVDQRASSDAASLTIRGAYKVHDELTVEGSIRLYRDERINGLDLNENQTDALDISTRLLWRGDLDADLTLYYRSRDFENVFSSARELDGVARAEARPVLDQFDVPGEGAGFLARVASDFAGVQVEGGLDGRITSGATNERFRNLGAGFTRDRNAGGKTWTVGAYAEALLELERLTIESSARVDFWRVFDASRTERDIEGAAPTVIREDSFDSRSGSEFSGRLGATFEVTGAIDVALNASRSWRLPTINEFFRPFRVGNDITEANPGLTPEGLWGLDASVIYQPLASLRVEATYFRRWLEDGVGNVTIGFGPGFFPLGGFVPEGGVLRQRANIDRQVTDGLAFAATIDLSAGWSGVARYQFADARITRFSAQPDLVGNRPVQTPRHSIFAEARYDHERFDAYVGARFDDGRFDDDLNQRALPSAFTVNMGAGTWLLEEIVRLDVAVENLFDARVVSALDSGLVATVAQPQRILFTIGVRF